MKSVEKIAFIIISALIIGAVVLFYISGQQRLETHRQYVDSLYKQSRESITFDSIASVVEKRLMDSIADVRQELQIERDVRRRETKTIRLETQRIRNRLDSIGPIDRPDF